ncbi:alpha/beta hydrolase [soil metagenome]
MDDGVSAVTERFELTTTDGETLEARWDSPEEPQFTTVFCHPSPVEGGSMMAPLMIAVTQKLVARGHSVLRFNFRGVGSSTGDYGGGDTETADVDAAVSVASDRSDSVGIAGWSFGAAVAMNWLIENESGIPYVGIAPPTKLIDGKPPTGPRRIILGSREQVIDSDALKAFAIDNGIDLVITPGDHFFHGRGKRIGDLVGEGLEANGSG